MNINTSFYHNVSPTLDIQHSKSFTILYNLKHITMLLIHTLLKPENAPYHLPGTVLAPRVRIFAYVSHTP
jgi:hypothetical protein